MKRNPVTVARQIDYIFRPLLGKVLLGGMHPIGQILDYDERRGFQNKETEYIHAPIYVFDARRLDEDDETKDDEVVSCIDKYKLCSIPNEEAHPTLSYLVKEVQTHYHTTSCRKNKRSYLLLQCSMASIQENLNSTWRKGY